MERLAPLCMVMLLQLPPAEPITGWFAGEEGIVTSVVEVGTEPLHQLVVVFQSVLVLPNHIALVELHASSPRYKLEVGFKKTVGVIVAETLFPLVLDDVEYHVVEVNFRMVSKEGDPTLSALSNVRLGV